jgi:hypothetical protein
MRIFNPIKHLPALLILLSAFFVGTSPVFPARTRRDKSRKHRTICKYLAYCMARAGC